MSVLHGNKLQCVNKRENCSSVVKFHTNMMQTFVLVNIDVKMCKMLFL